MKKRYLIAAITALLFALSPLALSPVSAAMPTQIQACLKPKDYEAAPSQYREVARVKSGQSMLYYVLAIYPFSPLPDDEILISVLAGKCKRINSKQPFVPLTKVVSPQIAYYLAEQKWREIIKIPAGKQLAQGILHPSNKPDYNSMGEIMDHPVLPSEDIAALKKLGF